MSSIIESAITTDWTKANLQKLLAAMRSSISEQDRMSEYTEGLKAVDWKKVAFPPFSHKACKEKWGEILQMMRKTRTLTELIVEAEDGFSSPAKNKKAKYAENHQLANEDYNGGMLEFGKQSPGQKRRTYRKRKKASVDVEQCTKEEDGMPPKPPVNGYTLFCKEQMASMADVSRNAYVSAWAKRWRDLTEREREEYSIRCRKLKNQYVVKLNEYVQTLDKEKQKEILQKHGIKRPKKDIEEEVTFPGEPKTPTRSGNAIFCKDQMVLLKEKFPNSKERFAKISQMWKDLSKEEKERYKEKVKKNTEKYLKELQKWFQTLTPVNQEKYRKYNPSKCQYLGEETKVYEHEEKECKPSDSEDEDIEESSSDEEEDNQDCKEDEEEEEEEEEDDNMFDMY